MQSGFTAIDLVVLVVYVLGITLAGVWLGRGQTGVRDYFLGGRNLPAGAVLLSVVATETSSLTFLSIPGLAYATNLGFLQLTIGYLLGRIIVSLLLLPAYYRGELGTAYALLESRFGVATRRFASVTFMVTRALASGVRLFAAAIPLAVMTGWSYPTAILVMGACTLLYTYYGGIRSVVWIDAVQFAVYIVAALLALGILIGLTPGGLEAILSSAGEAGKLQVFRFQWSVSEPYTLWAGIFGGAFLSMATHGADQMIVQRLLTCRSLKQSQFALVGSGVVVMLEFALFLLIGIGLWHFYEARQFGRTDEIFVTFIIQQLPPGVTGLVIAGLFAAGMSSLSSAINSLASATTYDIIAPLLGGSERRMFHAGRISTIAWGVALVGGAMLVQSSDTPVVELGLAIASFTYGGLLGGFLLGVLNRRANQRDAIVGMATGILGMSLIVLPQVYLPLLTALRLDTAVAGVTWLGEIAWPWHGVIGTCVTVLVGSLLSLTHAPRRIDPLGTAGSTLVHR